MRFKKGEWVRVHDYRVPQKITNVRRSTVGRQGYMYNLNNEFGVYYKEHLTKLSKLEQILYQLKAGQE